MPLFASDVVRRTAYERRKTVYSEEGYLKVVVSTADGALPVADARVVIRGEDGREVVLFTNESGETERLTNAEKAAIMRKKQPRCDERKAL